MPAQRCTWPSGCGNTTRNPNGRCRFHQNSGIMDPVHVAPLHTVPPITAESPQSRHPRHATDERLEPCNWDETEVFRADPEKAINLLRQGYVPVYDDSLLNLDGEEVEALFDETGHGNLGIGTGGVPAKVRADYADYNVPKIMFKNGDATALAGVEIWIKDEAPCPELSVPRSVDEERALIQKYNAIARHGEGVDIETVNGGLVHVSSKETRVFGDAGGYPEFAVPGHNSDIARTPNVRYLPADMIVDIRIPAAPRPPSPRRVPTWAK